MTAQSVEIPGYIAGTWDIDPVHSHIGFVAKHLMVSKVRGNFTQFEGQIVTADDPLQSSASLSINTDSLETSNEQRNSDVKGENFLNVAEYPTMTYRSTGVRSLSGSEFLLDGELTIRGVTRPVELAAEINGFGPDPYGGTRLGFSATSEISRSDYGINVDIPLPSGGLVISEKIQITIEVEASLTKG